MNSPKSSYDSSDMVNTPPAPRKWLDSIILSKQDIVEHFVQITLKRLEQSSQKVFRIALDGQLGVNWESLALSLKSLMEQNGLEVTLESAFSYLKEPAEIESLTQECLPEDPIFGKVFSGDISDFFAPDRTGLLKDKLETAGMDKPGEAARKVFICYGSGAAHQDLQSSFDLIGYFDMTREEILRRFKEGGVQPLGMKDLPEKTVSPKGATAALPAYFGTRRLYYVDYPALDSHRNELLKQVDFYIDANDEENFKMIPGEVLRELLSLLTRIPVKPKPYYDPSPWGGQWLKQVRNLPAEMINCAWSYDLIEPESSFQVRLGDVLLEFPFSILVGVEPEGLMGKKGMQKEFQGRFPIRINYDDSCDGGDMALQSHPNDAYIRKHFNESFRQDESYYVVHGGEGAHVYLGLQEDADLEEFRKAVLRAEKEQIPFDHHQFVHSVPSKTGDLFLIPAGTLHASGKNECVLEISATTYRYTFHFYDFLRPGLDGKLRAIHSEHAFNALDSTRRANWVRENLVQTPVLLRRGRGWREYLLGKRPDMFFKVHRLEFEQSVEDDTQGNFHLLILVTGGRIRIIPEDESLATELPFSCLAVIPANLGRYRLEALGTDECQVVKALMA